MLVNASRAIVLRQMATQIALLLSCSALTLRAQAATDKGASALERTVDATVRPGDDFFAYANGGWLKATQIPEGKQRWSARDEINDVTRQRIARLLDDARSAPPGSTARSG
jgi:predicted metalloendopeptidase